MVNPNPDFRPSFKAELSMGMYDYMRYDKRLELADQLDIEINNGNTKAIPLFFAVLKNLYRNFRPIVYDAVRVRFDDKFSELKKLFMHWKYIESQEGRPQVPMTLMDSLGNFYADLLELKQMIGLGIRVERQESFDKKLKRAAGLTDD